jgi:hypothetical protein
VSENSWGGGKQGDRGGVRKENEFKFDSNYSWSRHVCICPHLGTKPALLAKMADTSSVYYRSDLAHGQNIAPRLGTPGTPDFFASILDFVRVTAPDAPLDPVIFQAIVLCVMAGNKHVILRPRDEDITVVQNLAALVSNFVFVSTTRPVANRLTVPTRY